MTGRLQPRQRILAALLPLLLLPPAVAMAQPAPVKTVLTIHWSSEDFPANPVVDEAIRRSLRQQGLNVEYFAEYLESDRFPPDAADKTFHDYVQNKYRGRPIDVVIANTNPALQFALANRDTLFPTAPIVYYGTEIADDIREAGAGVTGVLRTTAYDATLKLALELHPATREVFVVANSPSASYLEGVQNDLRPFSERVRITYINEPTVPRLIAAIKAVPTGSLLLYIRHSEEEPGNVRYPDEIARIAIPAANVPVYITSEAYFGSGAVGGLVRGMRTTGEMLGTLAGKLLTGARARDLPVVAHGVVPLFDWRQLNRWKIDERRLPAGAEIQFRVPGLWEHYGGYAMAALAFASIQALLIGYMLVQRQRRQRSEARNYAMLQALPDMMFLQSHDGVYLDYHSPDRQRLLVGPEKFLGHRMQDVLPPHLAAAFEECFSRLRTSQDPCVFEYSMALPGGERHYEARLVPCEGTQVLSIVRDVTDRKRVEASLRESQERYSRATAGGGVVVWDWNLETNDIHVDPALYEMLGYVPGEMGPDIEAWFSLVVPEDLSSIKTRLEQYLRSTSPFYVEYRMRHRDGSVRWFMTRGSSVWERGRPVRLTGTTTEITARKRSELALEATQVELERISRLTALGELASSIGHEMRQPLATIGVITKVCERWLEQPEPHLNEVRQAIRDIASECERATEMIRRHGDLFRHRKLQKTALDINSVVLEVLGFLQLRLQAAGVTLFKAFAADLPEVDADRVELQQLLINLIVNSMDAMEPVERGLRRLKLSTAVGPDDTVVVSVSDSGIGLGGVDLSRMYQSSYTTKVNGTGVGLAICRTIVDAHDGRIWAEPNAGVGATFSFALPARTAGLSAAYDSGSDEMPSTVKRLA